VVGKKKVFFFLKDKSAELASALIEATIKGGERAHHVDDATIRFYCIKV
jgi:hypothetical protein